MYNWLSHWWNATLAGTGWWLSYHSEVATLRPLPLCSLKCGQPNVGQVSPSTTRCFCPAFVCDHKLQGRPPNPRPPPAAREGDTTVFLTCWGLGPVMSEALSRKLQSFLSSALTSFAQRRNFDVSGGWAGQRAYSSPSPPDGWCHCDHCLPQATLACAPSSLPAVSVCNISVLGLVWVAALWPLLIPRPSVARCPAASTPAHPPPRQCFQPFLTHDHIS